LLYHIIKGEGLEKKFLAGAGAPASPSLAPPLSMMPTFLTNDYDTHVA